MSLRKRLSWKLTWVVPATGDEKWYSDKAVAARDRLGRGRRQFAWKFDCAYLDEPRIVNVQQGRNTQGSMCSGQVRVGGCER